jgi:hypothetical protein
MTMPENPRVTAAVEHELDKLQRIFSNLKRAADEGRITPHDHDERAMRADQWTAYASDADGNDLDGGWRLDTRLEAEHVAAEYARDLARSA